MKSIKVIITLISIVTLISGTPFQSGQAVAEEILVSTKLFTDVGESNWANKFIMRMNLREVVTGYGDNTFKPNQGVNQLEAVTMMIRFLDYTDAAKEFESIELDKESTIYEYVKDVPTWAKASVAVAYQMGIIDKTSQAGFEPYKEATRAWIAKLIVDGVKKRGALEELTKLTTFTDDNDIPTWAYYAVNEAVKAKITTGNADGTFQPNRTVTRAELTAFMYRSERYIPDKHLKDVIRGTVEQSQDDSIIINLGNDQLKRIYFAVQPTLYYEYDRIEKRQIKIGDQISAMTNRSGNIVFLDVLEGPKREEGNLQGFIILVDATLKVITIQDSEGSLHSFKLANEYVVHQDGKALTINQIDTQDNVSLVIKDDQVIEINLIESFKSKIVGEVISVNSEKKIITVQLEDGTLGVYSITEKIKLVDMKGKTESISSVSIGDKLSLSYEEDKLVSIQLSKFSLENVKINNLTKQTRAIELAVEGKNEAFVLATGAKINITGYYMPGIDELASGDIVNVTVKENKIVEIDVLNRSKQYYMFDSIDINAKMLKVKSVRDASFAYISYHEWVVPVRSGQSLSSISSLYFNERVELSISDEKITEIQAASIKSARIEEVNHENNWMKVKDSNNINHFIMYSEDIIVTIGGQKSTIDKLRVGDNISYYSIKEIVKEIIK